MEVTRVEPSPIQHILVHKMRLYCRYSAVSGTTTGASLSLAITEHTLHTPNGREDVVIKSAATMNALTNIKKQQLHPLNCLIRLVIQYRSGPAPVPVPVPFPAPCFSSCPIGCVNFALSNAASVLVCRLSGR